MKKKIYLLLLYSAFIQYAGAQLAVSNELKTSLQNKSGFSQVMKAVTDYYVQKDYRNNPKLFSQFKKWNRWAWYESRHLDANGDFVNSSQKNEPLLSAFNDAKNSDSHREASNTGAWVSIGPNNIPGGIGRVDRIAFHPTNANIMYAGATAGGVWVSYDAGLNWNALNGYVPQLGVSGIAIDADNPNTLYVLSGDGDSYINGGLIYQRKSIGILKSTDGGLHWAKLSNILPAGIDFFGFKLIQSQDFHNRFFACTSDGLYRSNDYGQTWVRDAAIGETNVFDIEQGAPNTGYIYAATQSDVYVSVNWGNPFVKVRAGAFSKQPTNATQRTALAVCPSAPKVLYVLFGGDGFLYRSNDNGDKFTLVNPTAPTTSVYTCAMGVNPTNVNSICIGNVNLQTSTDGGKTFFTHTANDVHADFHDLTYNPLNNFLYAGCDGGVYRSCCSDGIFWSGSYTGLNITQYYHMAGFEGNDNLAIGGAQDNGVQSRNGSNSFSSIGGGDGFEAKFLNGNSNIAYFSSNAGVFKHNFTTNSNQLSLLPGGNIDSLAFFFPSLAIHPTNNKIVYAGYTVGVYRTTNDGVKWDSLKGPFASAGFAAAGGLAVSAEKPDRLYAANGVALSVSDDQGTTWRTISGKPGWPGGVLTITDVQTRNNNADEVWVTFGGYGRVKVIYSSDAGATWNNFTGSLPNLPVYCIEYTNEGDVYIGTDAGVYFMDFAMSDWVYFSNGLPLVPVTEVVVNETNGSIKAATFGRGIWQSDLYSDCGPLLLLGSVVQGSNFYQSGGVIETTQEIPGSLGNSVKYRSPTKIIFKKGFSIKKNAYMHALIGPCGQGVFRLGAKGKVISKEEQLRSGGSLKFKDSQ
jgi:hypothetical protein